MLLIYSVESFFMHLIFMGQGYPRKLFNHEHFPIYGMLHIPSSCIDTSWELLYSYDAMQHYGI